MGSFAAAWVRSLRGDEDLLGGVLIRVRPSAFLTYLLQRHGRAWKKSVGVSLTRGRESR